MEENKDDDDGWLKGKQGKRDWGEKRQAMVWTWERGEP